MLFQSLRRGWRASATFFMVVCTLVFIINLTVLIYASRYPGDGSDSGILVLREGNTQSECASISRLNTWAHLLINLLSTILLAGSNYCMQCLSAPTRSEIDRAHARGGRMDIGIPSIRNLFRVDRKRLGLWLILGASSLPLHLLYVPFSAEVIRVFMNS